MPKVTTPAANAPTIESALDECLLEPPRHPLEEQIEVAGETFHTKGIRRVFADASMPITSRGNELAELQCVLVPEPWNPHDRNAIAIMIGRHQVGYLPAECAEEYVEPLGILAARRLLATGQARVWAKSDSGVVRARVTLLLPEG